MKFKRDVRNNRAKLKEEWILLKNMLLDETEDMDKVFKLRELKNEIYKKWLFYDKLLKVKNENTLL